MEYVENTLGADESGTEFLVVGNCDLWVSGLVSGEVKVEVKFPNAVGWIDMPEGSFIVDTAKTVFISEHGVRLRFTGVGNNAGVYTRLARYKN